MRRREKEWKQAERKARQMLRRFAKLNRRYRLPTTVTPRVARPSVGGE